MNLRSSPTTGQLRAIGKLFSSDGDSETEIKSSQIVKPKQRTIDGGVPLLTRDRTFRAFAEAAGLDLVLGPATN